jgi:hypothetical protein
LPSVVHDSCPLRATCKPASLQLVPLPCQASSVAAHRLATSDAPSLRPTFDDCIALVLLYSRRGLSTVVERLPRCLMTDSGAASFPEAAEKLALSTAAPDELHQYRVPWKSCTHMHTHMHTHVHAHACTCARTHAHTHMHTHAHAHARTRARTHTHAHARPCTRATCGRGQGATCVWHFPFSSPPRTRESV